MSLTRRQSKLETMYGNALGNQTMLGAGEGSLLAEPSAEHKPCQVKKLRRESNPPASQLLPGLIRRNMKSHLICDEGSPNFCVKKETNWTLERQISS